MRLPQLLALLVLAAAPASADIYINEIYWNPPLADEGMEFIELASTTGGVESMAGLTLIVLEGDGSGAGVIERTIDLSAFATGTSGLWLFRDTADALLPAPDPGTVITVDPSGFFAPDLENGSQTFLIVTGFAGLVGDDLDIDDDGVLDSTPWSSVVDAVGTIDGASDHIYAAGLGGTDFAFVSGFDPEGIILTTDGTWIAADTIIATTLPSTGPPPYGSFFFGSDPVVGTTEVYNSDGTFIPLSGITPTSGTAMTPGSANATSAVPEPSSYALAALIALIGWRRLRDRGARGSAPGR